VFAKGECAVLEQKFVGEEFSLMSWCDGEHLAHMPPVQDHKRAYVGDTGPNTGGMGSYTSPGKDGLLPFMTKADLEAAQAINAAMVSALKKENNGVGFKGVLYGAFMCTKRGVGCIEFNARFGDPEALNLLALLESDIISIMEGVVKGSLDQSLVKMSPLASVVKYAVPFGYPDSPQKGSEIDISAVEPASLFLASVDVVDGKLVELGSRTGAIVMTGKTVAEVHDPPSTPIVSIRSEVAQCRWFL
jgi:phosphoribosylamine--glycine ligase